MQKYIETGCRMLILINVMANLMTRFGWAKVLKFHPVLLFSCLLHGQKLKLAEVYLNPNIARFDKISTNGDSEIAGLIL